MSRNGAGCSIVLTVHGTPRRGCFGSRARGIGAACSRKLPMRYARLPRPGAFDIVSDRYCARVRLNLGLPELGSGEERTHLLGKAAELAAQALDHAIPIAEGRLTE